MVKYVQYDDNGNISVITGSLAPICDNQIEMPLDTVTDGMMMDLATMTLISIPQPVDQEDPNG